MRLSLETRGVGDVTIVRCKGRIVAGGETELLHVHVHRLMEDRTDIVLHLGDVVFIDSSGLGMLVRLMISMRKNGGDLKLCNVPQDVHKVLKMTNLNTLFAMHESEEDAISAFYRRNATSEPKTFDGPRLLCVDPSPDVLAYLRLVANPRDELAWQRVLKLIPNVGPATAQRIWERIAYTPDPLALVVSGGADGCQRAGKAGIVRTTGGRVYPNCPAVAPGSFFAFGT